MGDLERGIPEIASFVRSRIPPLQPKRLQLALHVATAKSRYGRFNSFAFVFQHSVAKIPQIHVWEVNVRVTDRLLYYIYI